MTHREVHRSSRAGWLRAAVLGADDGLVSTAALLVGLVAAGASKSALMTAGAAALTAGALSMAIGEYVSVSAQSDAEKADVKKEAGELEQDPEQELAELVAIYEQRGLSHELATQVATALHAHDALAAHLRDELGHDERTRARPVQAAGVSAVSFAVGSALPLLSVGLTSSSMRIPILAFVTIVSMCVLGGFGAQLGGASALRGALRVGIGGCLALVITYGVGLALGATV
ncbi:MAG: VIT1/CCC1 transporter family protein [Acidimicrobiales bacterium]